MISTIESHRIEARRPFLNLQLSFYQEVTKNTSILATSYNQTEWQKAKKRFWQLYWGELAMVENGGIKADSGGVESAILKFGNELLKCPLNQKRLKELSLDLAHTCDNSLVETLGDR